MRRRWTPARRTGTTVIGMIDRVANDSSRLGAAEEEKDGGPRRAIGDAAQDAADLLADRPATG